MRSFRNSDHGYVNKEEIQVSFASLEDYVSAIENYIEQGDLIAEKEFYSAVRFRGQKVNHSFLDKGITTWNSVTSTSTPLSVSVLAKLPWIPYTYSF